MGGGGLQPWLSERGNSPKREKFAHPAQAGAPGLAQGTARSTRLWNMLLPMCSIVWHVHIPKTGGTSVQNLLKANTTDFVDLGHCAGCVKGAGTQYVQHGSRHDWSKPNLLALARRSGRKRVIVSAETGVDDLAAARYPWFASTCFFAVLREPSAWVLSAENHMRTKYGNRDGVNGTAGYFDRPDIQARMVGFNATARSVGGVVMCVCTIQEVDAIVAAFSSAGDGIHHDGARNYIPVRTPLLEEVLRTRYALDTALWEVVSRRRMLCW